MEIHKALEEVENALTALKIKDRFGEYCEGLEVIGLVAFQGGDDYEKLVDDFGSGTITPVEYRDRMI